MAKACVIEPKKVVESSLFGLWDLISLGQSLTLSSGKKVTFIILPFAYLSWILVQVQPSWSWSLLEGASLSFPWDREAFQQN